jgi:hypothetical protein
MNWSAGLVAGNPVGKRYNERPRIQGLKYLSLNNCNLRMVGLCHRT